MLELNKTYQAVVEMTTQGQICMNVFYYKCTSLAGAPTLEDAASSIISGWWNVTKAILSTATTFSNIVITDITIPEGEQAFVTYVFSGTEVGQPLPSFVSLGFRLIRTNRTTRHGYKRLAGSTEAVVEGNEIAAVFDGAMNAIATWLENPILFDDAPKAFTLVPYIVRLTNVIGEPRVVDREQPVANAVFYGVTTQSSRKPTYSV